MKAVGCYGGQACAVTEDGKVFVLRDANDQPKVVFNLPQGPHDHRQVRKVSCGPDFRAILTYTGNLYAMGTNTNKRFGGTAPSDLEGFLLIVKGVTDFAVTENYVCVMFGQNFRVFGDGGSGVECAVNRKRDGQQFTCIKANGDRDKLLLYETKCLSQFDMVTHGNNLNNFV